MNKPGERTARYKKMAATWRKQHAHRDKYPPVLPPDDELMRLYSLLGAALRIEYLHCEDDFSRAAPPERVSLADSSRWIVERWRENKDLEWETAYIIQTLIMPGLGRGVTPSTEKLRSAAIKVALLRQEWRAYRARLASAELPAPFLELMPVYLRYIGHLGGFFEGWPDAIERHVQMRVELGDWDEESCRTLMMPPRGDIEELDLHNERTSKEVGRLLQEAKNSP